MAETIFKPGMTLKTRDGRDARVYAIDGEIPHPIHGAILTDGKWALRSWTEEGRFDHRFTDPAPYDLMQPKRELWVNVYPWPLEAFAYVNKTEADDCADVKRIARIRVEYTEGQFDD